MRKNNPRMGVPKKAVNKDQPANGKANHSQNLAQMIQLLLQRGLLVLIGLEHLGNMSDLGVHPGPGNQSFSPAVGNQGGHKGGVFPVPDGDVLVQYNVGFFVHGNGFPR